jgi:hypothetical protein
MARQQKAAAEAAIFTHRVTGVPRKVFGFASTSKSLTPKNKSNYFQN